MHTLLDIEIPVNGSHWVVPFLKRKDSAIILQYFTRGRNYKHHLVQSLQYTDTQIIQKTTFGSFIA